MQMNSNGRRPQKLKRGISQQPLVYLSQISNFCKENQSEGYLDLKRKRRLMEDNLAIFNVEYLSHYW